MSETRVFSVLALVQFGFGTVLGRENFRVNGFRARSREVKDGEKTHTSTQGPEGGTSGEKERRRGG